jgi:DNA modification methylase
MEINRIYNENCLETMAKMPSNFVDMVLTSPPYDDLRNYEGYEFDFQPIAKELFRIVKENGIVIWVVGDKTENGTETGTSFKQALYFKEIGFNLHDTMLYYKNNPMPTTGNRYHQHFEYMFAFSKGSPKIFNPLKEITKYRGLANMKNRGKNGSLDYEKVERTEEKKVGNVFFYSIGGGISTKDKVAYQHPAIFPEQLAYDQIYTWTNENDLVYDCFMGSGTTAKVAQMMNRNWLGSEISQEYVIIAEQRLNYMKEQSLFKNNLHSLIHTEQVRLNESA